MLDRGPRLDTYTGIAEAGADKAQQQRLLAALNASERALRRDECGAWTILGKYGRIYTWGDGKTWTVAIETETARAWTAAKERLAFLTVTQDGDSDGVLRLGVLPTTEQAAQLRYVLGIAKRVEYDPETLARKRQAALKARGVRLGTGDF